VVLTQADLANGGPFQTPVTSPDGGPATLAPAHTEFATFDTPRPGSYPVDQYRPAGVGGEIYCAPGEYPQRLANSDGQFLPYQYKVEPCATPVPNANHINSPDSGIGDPTLNASEYQRFVKD